MSSPAAPASLAQPACSTASEIPSHTIEEMTGLDVVEVNITVVDVYMGDNSTDGEPQRARVE